MPKTKRHAYSLVELIAVMGIGSSLMVLAMGVVHQSMSFATLGTESTEQSRTMARLSTQFRNDVRQSKSFEITEPVSLRVPQNDTTVIEYAVTSGHVSRVVIANGKVVQREQFELSDRANASLIVVDGEIERLGLIVRTDLGLQGEPARVDRQIIAVPNSVGERSAP